MITHNTETHDLHFEHRGSAIVLVDPTHVDGAKDVATAWEEKQEHFRWRLCTVRPDGSPYPLVEGYREVLMEMALTYTGDRARAKTIVDKYFRQPGVLYLSPLIIE